MQDRKKSPKIRHLGTITQLHRAISSQLRHVSTIRNILLNSNISPTCPHHRPMVNFGPLAAEIVSLVWGTPANFNGFRVFVSYMHCCITPLTRMWANAQPDGRPAERRWRPLFNAAVWLTPTTRVPCSNASKTQNPLKFAGVPQTRQ